jgi:hypothetical protein
MQVDEEHAERDRLGTVEIGAIGKLDKLSFRSVQRYGPTSRLSPERALLSRSAILQNPSVGGSSGSG